MLGLRVNAAAPPEAVVEVKKEGSWNVLVAVPVGLLPPEVDCISNPANKTENYHDPVNK